MKNKTKTTLPVIPGDEAGSKLARKRKQKRDYNKKYNNNASKNERKCSVSECPKIHYGKGLCLFHYNRSEDSKKRRKINWKRYYDNNLEKMRERQNKKRKENPEKYKKELEQWRKNNKQHTRDYSRNYSKKRMNCDINYRIRSNLRKRLSEAISRGYKKSEVSAVRMLGCTIEEFRCHLESKFQAGMNWDNYGYNGWHIDHIIPLSCFNLVDENQAKIACHFSNLQPLWCADNLKKSNKLGWKNDK